MTYCPKCRNHKEDGEFNVNSLKTKGKQTWCRECTTEYSRRWYLANKEKHRAYVKEHAPKKTHICKMCGKSEPDVIFYISKMGRYRYVCMECDAIYKKQLPSYHEDGNSGSRKRRKDNQKKQRKDKRFSAKFILRDSKQSDKKRGFENDLTLEFVKTTIANGCGYCGETELRVGLDRIDNSVGHLQSNVNPSCRRCNWLRRDMPYEAWLRIVPVIKEVAREGLFGDWQAGPNKSPQFKEAQKRLIFGSVAQMEEPNTFNIQDGVSSTSASTS